MRWFLSLHVFTVAMVASFVHAANEPHAFASGTNIAFLLPFIIFSFAQKQLTFMPTLFFLSAFLAFASLIHHINGCTSTVYRAFDYLSGLLLFAYLTLRAAWALFHRRRSQRLLLRLACVATIGLLVCYYDAVSRRVDVVMVIFGVTASLLIMVDTRMQARQPLGVSVFSTTLLACVIALGIAFNKNTDVWTDDAASYDMQHGMWHVLVAQFLFVLVYTLVTVGPLASEWVEMAWSGGLLIAFVVCLATGAVGNASFLPCFAITTVFLVVRWTALLHTRCIVYPELVWTVRPLDPVQLQFVCSDTPDANGVI